MNIFPVYMFDKIELFLYLRITEFVLQNSLIKIYSSMQEFLLTHQWVINIAKHLLIPLTQQSFIKADADTFLTFHQYFTFIQINLTQSCESLKSVQRMLRVLLLLLLLLPLLRHIFTSSKSQICFYVRFGFVHCFICIWEDLPSLD